MSRKRASLVVVAILITSTFFLTLTILPNNVRATTLYVGGPGPGNFTTIQDAINISNPGDTIFVFNGTYVENILVNESVNLVGEDRNTTIIDGGGIGDVVRISVSWVNISHFTVTNSGTGFFDSGVGVSSSRNNVSHVISRNNSLGIYLSWTNNITVYDCQILNNSEGVYLEYVDYSIVANSTTIDNRDGIYPYYSNYNKFVNNNHSDQSDCIYPDHSHFNFISGSTARNCRTGIDLLYSNNNTVINNDISNTEFVVYSEFSHYNIFADNILSNSTAGIVTWESHGNTYADNDASWNQNEGIWLERSNKNIILNNTFTNNPFGIVIYRSSDTTVRDNLMTKNGIIVVGYNSPENWNSHTIDTSNTVNGKPVYHWRNVTGGTIPAGAGQVLLVNCSDIIVENQNLSQASVGVQTSYSLGIQMSNITTSSNEYGVWLHQTNYSNLTGNIISNNYYDMYIEHSNHIIIENNSGLNDRGIRFYDSHNGTISNNTKAVQLVSSNDNLVFGNNVSNGRGFEILGSNDNAISFNTISADWPWNRVYLQGSNGNVVANNTFYTSGGIGLDQSSGNNIYGNNLQSMDLFKSTKNLIENNTISLSNATGINLHLLSDDNTIANNTIANHSAYGIRISDSINNTVHHNLFLNNLVQAHNNIGYPNSWDNGYPAGGNYWNDYNGTDGFSGPLQNESGSDGIGDTPYDIPGGIEKDRYPLTSPSGPFFPRPPLTSTAELSGNSYENVTLTWIGSPDDGAGFRTVVRYDIFRNSTYESAGQGYGFLASVPNGTYQYVDSSVGEGDPNNYFYHVCAVDFNDNSTCSKYQAGKFTRPLSKGLNLVSIPLAQVNHSREVVLQTVSFDNAWTFDAFDQEWRSFIRSKPYSGGLESVNRTMGLWLDVTRDSNLTVAGAIPLTDAIYLKSGWNLIGFPSFNGSYTVGDLKASLPVTRVEGLEPTAPPYFQKPLQDSDILQAGHGYWIQLSADATWTLSA
jgi:parallel beta-helix repeat protein